MTVVHELHTDACAQDGTLRYAYQPTATSKFGNHSLLATINVVRAVVAAAAQVREHQVPSEYTC